MRSIKLMRNPRRFDTFTWFTCISRLCIHARYARPDEGGCLRSSRVKSAIVEHAIKLIARNYYWN